MTVPPKTDTGGVQVWYKMKIVWKKSIFNGLEYPAGLPADATVGKAGQMRD